MDRRLYQDPKSLCLLPDHFGQNPLKALEYVRGGMGKSELQDKHDHILGLHLDINIDMPVGDIQVIMGAFRAPGKSTLIRHK
ncbi:MAG: hypothetical protein U5K75_05960 [Ahrensia sp.]|nr:hypothetical protein [Ahrensia sp.]